MRYYTWFQAMRMLAGMEPGAPGLPATAPTAPEPLGLCDLLADGVAAVEGVTNGAAIHEEIPRKAWLRMSLIVFEPRAHGSKFYESVATLLRVPGVPRVGTYRDLLFTETGIGALRAALRQNAVKPNDRAHVQPYADVAGRELLTLEQASALIGEQTKMTVWQARSWLLDELSKSKIEVIYDSRMRKWPEASLPLDAGYATSGRPKPLPMSEYWRVRKAEVTNAL
jgi:hypothetical protein